jgi:RsiW-degrading membrane proteinase PrsW (M82 family)
MLEVKSVKIDNSRKTWILVLLPTVIFLVVILVTNVVLGLGEVSNAFKRFANAFLTAYTLTAGAFFGAMFFYADSRNRPLAPLFGMLVATLVGALIMVAFLSQGELLMENNSSMQAQFFSNIVHLAIVFTALLTAIGLLGGITMAHITGNPPRQLPWPEMSEEE